MNLPPASHTAGFFDAHHQRRRDGLSREGRNGIMADEQKDQQQGTGDQKPEDATGQQGGDARPQNGGTDDRQYTKAEMEAIVKDRLEREKRRSAADAEKARKDAEEAALAEKGEYQRLAEERAKQIQALEQERAQLEPLTQQRDRFKGAVSKLLMKQREGVRPEFIPLLDRMDEADQLEYLAEHGDALRTAPERPQGTHIPATPGANGAQHVTEAELQRRREMVRRQARAAL